MKALIFKHDDRIQLIEMPDKRDYFVGKTDPMRESKLLIMNEFYQQDLKEAIAHPLADDIHPDSRNKVVEILIESIEGRIDVPFIRDKVYILPDNIGEFEIVEEPSLDSGDEGQVPYSKVDFENYAILKPVKVEEKKQDEQDIMLDEAYDIAIKQDWNDAKKVLKSKFTITRNE